MLEDAFCQQKVFKIAAEKLMTPKWWVHFVPLQPASQFPTNEHSEWLCQHSDLRFGVT